MMPESLVERVDNFIRGWSGGEYNEEEAIFKAMAMVDYFTDLKNRVRYGFLEADGPLVSQPIDDLTLAVVDSSLERLNAWLQKHEAGNISRGKKDNSIDGFISPVTWKGTTAQADIGWLYAALTERELIDCSATSFYRLFVDSSGKSIKADAESSRKSGNPRGDKMRSLIAEIGKYDPDSFPMKT